MDQDPLTPMLSGEFDATKGGERIRLLLGEEGLGWVLETLPGEDWTVTERRSVDRSH